jgi:hypothetical protein
VANLERGDHVDDADGNQPVAGDQGQDRDRIERVHDQHPAADHDDHAGECLPTAGRQVVEGQRGGEQGQPAE